MPNKLAIKFLLIFSLLLANDAIGKGSRSMELYYLHLETKNAIVTVLLNDAPIVKSNELDSISTVEPINTWLLDAHNSLSLKIEKPSDDGKEYLPSISASIFLHDDASETPKPKEILVTVEFSGDTESNYPATISKEINATFSVGTKLWREATPVSSLTDTDKKTIISLVNAFSNSLYTSDIMQAIKLQQYKIEDDAIAENKPVTQIENAVKTNYHWLSEQKGIVSHPLSVDTATFSACYDNRLIYIQRINGDEAVMLESDDLYFDVPIYVSKINGEWNIVR